MIAILHQAITGQRRILRLAIGCAVLAALAAVALLALSGWFLAGASIAGLSGIIAVQGFNYLLPSAGIRAAAIIRTGTRYGERVLGHRAALFALAKVRMGVFEMVAARALAGHDAGRSGAIANRLGHDVDTLEDAVIRQVSRPGAWTAAGAGLAAALFLGWAPGLAVLATLALMRGTAMTMAARLLPEPAARTATTLAALQADYAEMAMPCAEIAVYDLGPAMTAELARIAQDHEAARNDLVQAEAMIAAVQTVLATGGLALMIVLAHGAAPAFALGVLGVAAAMEIWAGLASTDMRRHQVALAQAHLADLTTPATVAAPVTPTIGARPAIRIGDQILPHGCRVLVRGRSGAGKTRLIETLAGLRRDAPQNLAVDGIAVPDLDLAALRPVFALADQDAQLLAGSVADNLRLARPRIDEHAMWRALAIAAADDVVRALPDGLQQWLGGDGARLSGGQKRRITLARALLAQRPWLMLDEPSEGLDAATEARLIETLRTWLDQTGTGLILVSHRPAMAALADRIIDVHSAIP